MIKQEFKKKWVAILFFSVVGLIFVYFIYFLATGAYDPTYHRWISTTEARNPLAQGEGNFFLQKNQERIVGKLKITYLGLETETLVIDLVLMDLDPGYAYRHRIPLGQAKRGFYLSDAHFRASSVTPTNVRLERRP